MTLSHEVRDLKDVDKVQTDELDFASAMDQSNRNLEVGLPLRFAIPVRVNYTVENSGTWETLKDGTRLWRLRVGAEGALSINLGFTEYRMPVGATMTILTPDGAEVIRPFTSADNQASNELWTPILNSDEVVIEVRIDEKRLPEMRLRLGQIGAGFRRFGSSEVPVDERGTSGSCNVDVACPEGNPWADEISAAGAYTVGGVDTCSGSMINNTANDRTPYFLTANHCGISTGNAASVVIYWNFQNSYCRVPGSGDSGGPGDGSLAQFSSGTTFRASASVSDFCLVQVNTPPNSAWGVTFAGWSREGLNPVRGACIHHPQVAEKRISFYDTFNGSFAPSHGSSWGCSPAPGPGDNTHISVYWSLGVTEPGSSGSPLYDDNQRIIGQLHGGPSSCSATGANRSDCYGRVSRSWTGNGTSSTRLSDWLDPLNTGAMYVDTLGKGMDVTPGTDTTHLGLLGGPFSPSSVVYVLNNSTPTPVNYSVSFVGGGTAPLTMNGGSGPLGGTLGAMSSTMVTIAVDGAANSLPAGIYATSVLFQDTTNGISYTRVHTLDVGTTGISVSPATGLLGGGPVGGPFSATQAYTVTSTKPTPVNVTVAGSASWISADGSASTSFTLSGTGDSRVVIAGFSAAANALGAGLYNGTVNFTNDSGGTGGTTRPVTLDVGRYTYTYPGPPINIPDNNATGIVSTLNITDAFCIGDVDVQLDITHPFIGDLAVDLIAPSGTTVRLHNRTGGSADNIHKTYDQGVVNPDGPGSLNDFNGQGAQGVWTMRVYDLAGSDLGSLDQWKLKIAQSGTPCPPTAKNFEVTVPDTVTSPVALQGVSTTNAPLTYTILSLPANGTLRDPSGNVLIASVPYTLGSGGSVANYKPNALFVGPDSFTYKCNDGIDSGTGTVTIKVGVPQTIVFWNMDVNPGWTYGSGWAYGVPQGLGGDPSSGYTGSNVVGYNLAGAYTNNLARTYTTTPAINLSGKYFTSLEFRRWLGVERAQYDHAGIEVSTNGTSWTLIWENPVPAPSINETAWSLQTYDLSAIADNQATVYVRWFMGPTDSSVVFQGWNLDDVKINGVVQPSAPPMCIGDADDDLDVDFNDITTVLANFGANYLPTPGTGLGDADDDGDVDFNDITTVLANFNNTCP
ncbi:MAG: proprotein convertase P-domain-containing protein [Phycisphaerae bacterium]|nr:proprotein convertase P-domain-containing protein [Phycisphaerae bacterium]